MPFCPCYNSTMDNEQNIDHLDNESNASTESPLTQSDKENDPREVADALEETQFILQDILATEALGEERMNRSTRYFTPDSPITIDARNAILAEQNRQIQDRDNAPPPNREPLVRTVAMDPRRGVHVYQYMDHFHQDLQLERFPPDSDLEVKVIRSYQDVRDAGHNVETVAVDDIRGVHVYQNKDDPNHQLQLEQMELQESSDIASPKPVKSTKGLVRFLHEDPNKTPLDSKESHQSEKDVIARANARLNARMLDFQNIALDGVPGRNVYGIRGPFPASPMLLWHCTQCNFFKGYLSDAPLNAGRYCGGEECLSPTKWHKYTFTDGKPAWCPELEEVYTFRDGIWVANTGYESPPNSPPKPRSRCVSK